jgi:hypothetical protein
MPTHRPENGFGCQAPEEGSEWPLWDGSHLIQGESVCPWGVFVCFAVCILNFAEDKSFVVGGEFGGV